MKTRRWMAGCLIAVSLLCGACAQQGTITQKQAEDLAGHRAVTIASATPMRTDDITVDGRDCYRFEMLVMSDSHTVVVGQVVAVSKDGRYLYRYDEQADGWSPIEDI